MKERAWPDLQAFLAVARTGSLALGASMLGTSSPTLGRRVARLEEELGLELFAKDTTGYRLTSAGDALLPKAEAVEAGILGFLRSCDGLSAEVSGSVRIALPETIASHVLAPRIQALHEAYPGLTVEFLSGPAFVNLPRRDADLAVRVGKAGEDDLYVRRIGTAAFMVYSPRRAEPTAIGRDTLMELPWVGWEDQLATVTAAQLSTSVFDPSRCVARASSFPLQATLAKQLGAALILPDFLGDSDIDLVRLVEEPLLRQPILLVTSAESRDAAKVKAVASWIVGAMQQAGLAAGA